VGAISHDEGGHQAAHAAGSEGAIPTVIHITDGTTHEVTVLDELLIEPSAFYLPDRGYLDCGRRYALDQSRAFFVTRAKSNTQFTRRYSHAVNRATTNVFCDQTGMLTVYISRKKYPAPLRRVVITDDDGKQLTFLTNNFVLTPKLIAALYRQRWQVDCSSRGSSNICACSLTVIACTKFYRF